MADFPVTFHGEKYNLQNFLHDHPGGVNTLEKFKGKSVVSVMEKYGHSTSAYHLMSDLKVDPNLDGSVSDNGRLITKEESRRNVQEIEFLEELETKIDWSKPLLYQLEAIAPHYSKWMNSSVYRRCRLFSNPLLESLTHTSWYVVPLVWVPVILSLGASQFYKHVWSEGDSTSLSVLLFILNIILGLMIWTGLEYSLHRWVFHFDPGSSVTLIKIHFLIHGLHHKMPFDSTRQVFPPVPAAILSFIILGMVWNLVTYPLIVYCGGILGYLIYDMIHFYVHHGSPNEGTYLYEMKRYHSNHHFVNNDKAYGISSSVWDRIFNTFVKVKKLGFSLKW